MTGALRGQSETTYAEAIKLAEMFEFLGQVFDLMDDMAAALESFENDDGHVPDAIWEERNRVLRVYQEGK